MSYPPCLNWKVTPACARSCRPVVFGLLALLLLATKASAVVPWTLFINTNNIVVITNAAYGAVGDGVATNTTAIQNAINAATAGTITNGLTGGTVEIPPGIYLSGPIAMKKNVNLQIDAGAILRMLPFGKYPVTWHTNNGTNIYFVAASDFITGSSLTNIALTGAGMVQGQGEPWWPWADTNNAVRPDIFSLSGCKQTLIQGVTLSNSPEFHIAISGTVSTTVQGVTIRANPSSDPVNPGHNTDACDVSGTNILVQNNNISVGDDNYTCGGGTSSMLITNNTYGNGHGVSIGSYTSPSVSNMMVINCTFTNTDAGLRIKSDRGRGGFVHNISYLNLTMTNVLRPILIYGQYLATASVYRAVDSISPGVAASYPSAAVNSTTPTYREITISNVTANAQSSPPRTAGLIWGLPEMSISNVTLIKVRLIGSKTFGIYCAKGVNIIDCTHSVPNNVSQFSFYDADVTFSNSTPSASVVTLDGVTSNSIANRFAFYNSLMTLKNTNALGFDSSVTLGASTFIISNNFVATPSNNLNFILGTNAATIVVKGNLVLGGTNNITAGNGFTNGTYTLMTYTGTLGGLPTLGTVPAGYNYAYDTGTAGQVKLVVTLPAPPAPTNLVVVATNLMVKLKWNSVSGATNYNVKRSTVNNGPYPTTFSVGMTNYDDAAVSNAVNYYYVVTAINSGGESTNSAQVSVVPLPSSQPANIGVQAAGNQLQLSWPQDHLGWRLQIQTNDLTGGLGTNWTTVPNSTNVMGTNIIVNPANENVFLRLVYP